MKWGILCTVNLPRWAIARSSIERIAMPAADEIPSRLLYAPCEAERLLGISHATCYRLIKRGLLDARKIGARTGITAGSIERFLADLPRAGGPA